LKYEKNARQISKAVKLFFEKYGDQTRNYVGTKSEREREVKSMVYFNSLTYLVTHISRKLATKLKLFVSEHTQKERMEREIQNYANVTFEMMKNYVIAKLCGYPKRERSMT